MSQKAETTLVSGRNSNAEQWSVSFWALLVHRQRALKLHERGIQHGSRWRNSLQNGSTLLVRKPEHLIHLCCYACTNIECGMVEDPTRRDVRVTLRAARRFYTVTRLNLLGGARLHALRGGVGRQSITLPVGF